ncbi:hypothetical protein OAS39_06075, partial [Pirellulales bacterium]|nr:hypothetical protein [Pirellulales bacterium]
LFQPLLFLIGRSTTDELQKQVEFFKAESEMLRTRVPQKRIFLQADERARLLKLGKEFGPGIRQAIRIVGYSTFRRWVSKEAGAKTKRRKCRPRIAKLIRQLVVKLANETGWGYSRILGELRKLRVGKILRQSVKNILVEHGIDPGPKRGRGTWHEFVKVHAETLWQVAFFSKRIWTDKGPRQVSAMVFLHVASRKVVVTPATCKRDAVCMKTQAQAFLRHAEDEQLACSTIMRDHDGKYSADFDRVFTE